MNSVSPFRTILAVESSCDETSLALVRENCRVEHQLIASQIAEHRPFGGVVPELASRGHLRRILPLVDQLFDEAETNWDGVDAIAVTAGPGLIGSLLVGVETAKTLAWLHKLPLLPVNHLLGHVFSIFLHDDKTPDPEIRDDEWPLLSLVISGGHTMLLLQRERGGAFELLGQTIDDAVGEAYDKVAKVLALGYPGGPIIDKISRDVDPGELNGAPRFPRPLMNREGYDFSYSGLKTSFITAAKRLNDAPHNLDDASKRVLCAAFQEAAVDCLAIRLKAAIEEFDPGLIGVVGGVACNSRVRERVAELGEGGRARIVIPRPVYCTDNAAMIAAAALEAHRNSGASPGVAEFVADPRALRLNADANLAFL